MTHAPAAVASLLGATKSSSNGSSTLLIFAVIGAAFYFLIYRPQQRKQKAARAQSTAYDVGDEVVTAGGIVGHVLDITDDRVTLETSVGASFTVLRPYVLRKLEPAEAPEDVVGDQHEHHPEPPPGPPGSGDELERGATGHEGSAEDGSPESPAPRDHPAGDGGDEPDASGADGPPII